MNKLIIIISGENDKDISIISKFIFIEFINRKIDAKRFVVLKKGRKNIIVDRQSDDKELDEEDFESLIKEFSVKIYNAEDALKHACQNMFGLDDSQCYGPENDRDTETHVLWDDMPEEIRDKHGKTRKGAAKKKAAFGQMTANELVHVFGKEICEKIDRNCWARSLYSLIDLEGNSLAIINGTNGPNQVTMGTERGARVIKLLSKDDTDELPLGEYNLIIDSEKYNLKEKCKRINLHLDSWFKDYRIL